MTDYAACILYLVPGAMFSIEGSDYAGIRWNPSNAQPLPTQAQLEAAWPAAQAQAAALVSNAATLEAQADAALNGLRTYRDNPSPTAAQTAAQVKLQAKVLIGIIRLLRQRLDATD